MSQKNNIFYELSLYWQSFQKLILHNVPRIYEVSIKTRDYFQYNLDLRLLILLIKINVTGVTYECITNSKSLLRGEKRKESYPLF